MSSTKNVAGTATYTNGDTTITITIVDGEPRFTVTSTSAKVVTIPASFGRRPKKTGDKSRTGDDKSKTSDDKSKTSDDKSKTGDDKSKMPDKSKSAESMNKSDNLQVTKRPTSQPYHPTTPSERYILERAIRHAHNFAKPGKGLIPPPTRNWSERPGPLPEWAQKAKEREEGMEDEDADRGCGPEYDLHPDDDDEHFTDVWYDDGE